MLRKGYGLQVSSFGLRVFVLLQVAGYTFVQVVGFLLSFQRSFYSDWEISTGMGKLSINKKARKRCQKCHFKEVMLRKGCALRVHPVAGCRFCSVTGFLLSFRRSFYSDWEISTGMGKLSVNKKARKRCWKWHFMEIMLPKCCRLRVSRCGLWVTEVQIPKLRLKAKPEQIKKLLLFLP